VANDTHVVVVGDKYNPTPIARSRSTIGEKKEKKNEPGGRFQTKPEPSRTKHNQADPNTTKPNTKMKTPTEPTARGGY